MIHKIFAQKKDSSLSINGKVAVIFHNHHSLQTEREKAHCFNRGMKAFSIRIKLE